jgi:putative glutamine amidotransferase
LAQKIQQSDVYDISGFSWETIVKHSAMAALLFFLAFFVASTAGAEEAQKANARKPIIGVNCDISGDKPRLIGLSALYLQALKNSGAIAVVLPPMPEEDLNRVLKTLDGVMMIGGADYPPTLYGQKTEDKTEVMDEERWRFDILLAKTVVEKTKLPFLGICAGCQALNISRGGSLVQDIPTKFPDMKVAHASKEGWQKGFNKHEVRFAKLTKLKGIYGIDSLNVPTSHHQCVDKTGDEMAVAATTDDGVVEAIEMKGQRFVVGVQWHPERDFSANRELFKKFVSAAGINGGDETASLQRRFSAE